MLLVCLQSGYSHVRYVYSCITAHTVDKPKIRERTRQDYASTARELGPRQELVDKAEQSLPHRVEEYRQVNRELYPSRNVTASGINTTLRRRARV